MRVKIKPTMFKFIMQRISHIRDVSINNNNAEEMLAIEMEYCRRCCGLTTMIRVTNEKIQREMQVEINIVKYIEEKRLLWYGHVQLRTSG